MNTPRTFVVLLALVSAAAAPLPAFSAPTGHRVVRLESNRMPVNVASHVLVTGPNGRRTQLKVGELILDKTTIQTPPDLTITLRSTDGLSTAVIAPSTTFQLLFTGRGHASDVVRGKVDFSESPHNPLSFFRVSHGTRFVAAARGTKFSVEVGANHITFTCTEHAIDVIRTGTVLIRDSRREIEGIREVTVLDAARYPASQSWPLALEEYVNTFHTLGGARTYYYNAVQSAGRAHDLVRENDALDALARLLDQQGSYSQAFIYAQRSMEVARQLPGGADNAAVAAAYYRLAWVERDLGQEVQALRDSERATQLWDRLDPAAMQAGHGWAENGLGLSYNSFGRYEDARRAFQRGLAVFERAEPAPGSYGTMVVLENIAGIDEAYEDYVAQLHDTLRALAIAKHELRQGGVATPRIARLYENVAAAYSHVGEGIQSANYAKLALKAWREVMGGDRYAEVAWAYFRVTNDVAVAEHAIAALQKSEGGTLNESAVGLYESLASAYSVQGRYDDARAAYAKATIIAEHLARNGAPKSLLNLYGDLSGEAQAEGDPQGAVSYARERVALAQKSQAGSSWLRALAYDGLADSQAYALDFPAEVDARRHAVQAYTESVGAAHPIVQAGVARLAAAELRAGEPAGGANLATAVAAIDARGFPVAVATDILQTAAMVYERRGERATALKLRERVLTLDRTQKPLNRGALVRDDVEAALDVWLSDANGAGARYIAEARAAVLAGKLESSWTSSDLRAYFGDVADLGTVRTSTAIQRRRHPESNDLGLARESHVAPPPPGMAADGAAKRQEYESARRYDRFVVQILRERRSGFDNILLARRLRLLAYDDAGLEHANDMAADVSAAADALDRAGASQRAEVAVEYSLLLDFATGRVDPAILRGLATRAEVAAGRSGANADDAQALVSAANARSADDPAAARRTLTAAMAILERSAPDERRELVADAYDTLAVADQDAGRGADVRRDETEATTIRESIVTVVPGGTRIRRELVTAYDDLVVQDILAHDTTQTLQRARRGLALAPERLESQLRMAEALLFTGDVDAAKALYRRYRTTRSDRKTFTNAALRSLRRYQAAGVDALRISEVIRDLQAP